MKYYTIYRKLDDKIIATGTAKECMKQLNLKPTSFYCMVSRAKKGEVAKTEVYVSNKYCEE